MPFAKNQTDTCFPEAIPLRTLKAKNIVKALINFFSTFGLSKVVETDQETHFMSKVFTQVLNELKIKHQTSSPYHPESQGELERFHQTLKTMLRKYCLEFGKSWDEGLPLCYLQLEKPLRNPLDSVRQIWYLDKLFVVHSNSSKKNGCQSCVKLNIMCWIMLVVLESIFFMHVSWPKKTWLRFRIK